jgi:hypothetical protein
MDGPGARWDQPTNQPTIDRSLYYVMRSFIHSLGGANPAAVEPSEVMYVCMDRSISAHDIYTKKKIVRGAVEQVSQALTG